MTNYLDNKSNEKWEWKNDGTSSKIIVDHGDHYHELDVTDITLEQMTENTNQVLGDAHRASDHYKK